MANNLRRFNTEADYNAAELNYPAVSWVTGTDAVHFDKTAPMNIITYNASAKLSEAPGDYESGLHTNAFSGTNGQQLTMTSHTFENGVGIIKFNGDIANIGQDAFYRCTSLTSVNIPNSVTSIGDGAFYFCSALTSITIPSGVTRIGTYAFYLCRSLTSIIIPNGVTSIGESAFGRCTSLTSVTVDRITPPTLDYSAFDDTNNCPIYVPSASVDTYKSATNWVTYASRIQAIPQ